MKTIVVHDIDTLSNLQKTGLLESCQDYSYRIIDVTWEQGNKVSKLILEPLLKGDLLQLIDSDVILSSQIQDLYNAHGHGCDADELMTISYCKDFSTALLTDDISMTKMSYKESIQVYSYNYLVEYILNINFENEKLIDIKKSGRKPT